MEVSLDSAANMALTAEAETSLVTERLMKQNSVEKETNSEFKFAKVEVKLTKIDETKFLDKNENSIDNCETLLNELMGSPDEGDTKSPATSPATLVSNLSSPVYSPSSTTITVPAIVIAAKSDVVDAGPSKTKKHIKPHSNGTLPKSGKPMLSDLNKRLKQRRGRQPKAKAVVAVYQSQITDNSHGIKLCIKKSDPQAMKASKAPKSVKPKPAATKQKRTRKPKQTRVPKRRASESDSDAVCEKRKKKSNNNVENSHAKEPVDDTAEQSVWGRNIPSEILSEIFYLVTKEEGCFPTMIRLGRVCSLWRSVSLDSQLWHTIDLSTTIKERNKTELRLKWFIENRFKNCLDLNLANWKIGSVLCVLEKLLVSCPNLVAISLAGWKGLTSDNLQYLTENFPNLERLDLSLINVEMNSIKSAVGVNSLINAIQNINSRLTHLHLAHNRLAGVPLIVNALTTHCPQLTLLDLSNVKTIAASHGVLHVEKFQEGCPKLKILRITNSHITLSIATLQEQMESPGFPELEELSVASLADESRLISDESLQRILKSSTKLKLLDVRGCARLTHDSLIRLPAWDLKHLFLSGCSVTRDIGSGLELIASKWAHSLIEFDLAWANVQSPLDNALIVLADKREDSPLNHLNLCGSAVSSEAVKELLTHCVSLNSINLSSCRGLPRGIKRLLQGKTELNELRENLGVAMKS